MKKKIALLITAAVVAICLTSCASWDRTVKSFHSDMQGGLTRRVNVYSYDGKLVKSFEGKIDIQDTDAGNKVLFDLNGKRYAYYNCLVEVVEK